MKERGGKGQRDVKEKWERDITCQISSESFNLILIPTANTIYIIQLWAVEERWKWKAWQLDNYSWKMRRWDRKVGTKDLFFLCAQQRCVWGRRQSLAGWVDFRIMHKVFITSFLSFSSNPVKVLRNDCNTCWVCVTLQYVMYIMYPVMLLTDLEVDVACFKPSGESRKCHELISSCHVLQLPFSIPFTTTVCTVLVTNSAP